MSGEWDDRLGIGNPVSHLSIKAYLKCVREEQAGNCSSDLGRTKSKEVLLFSDSSELLFNHTFGKTFGGNSTHSFSVKSSSNSNICPVRNFMLYLSICCLINVDNSQGYLFRATNKAGHVSDKPFLVSSVYNRFKQYLKYAGLDDGETPHSLRAGCSITLQLLGVSKSAIA